jgi:uncharacterized damage-inducible protein DinB
MSPWQAFSADSVFTFQKHKAMAEKAFGQLDDGAFFRKPGEHSNSVAVIVKHLAGNLHSRWTDFLTTDGDKPWRDRDAEFVIGPEDSRERLLAAWEQAWGSLFQTLGSLTEEDCLKTVRIRGEEHSVLQAIQRSLAHTVYHVGQITYLARLLTTGDWKWITIPPGGSKDHTRKYLP